MNANDLIPTIILFCSVLFFTGLFWFPSYTGLTQRQGMLAMLLWAVLGSIYCIRVYSSGAHFPARQLMNGDILRQGAGSFLPVACVCALLLFLTALGLRLWGRWVGDKETAEERRPGLPGVRAWFCTSNVAVGAVIVVCAWLSEGISPLLSALGVSALLAAAPLLRMEYSATASALEPVPEDLSPEREKIVSMLEAGKLTADESAELLQALGATKRAATPPRAAALTAGQRLMLIGAALVAIGFFLPWFVVNPGSEAGRMMTEMQRSLQSQFGNLEMPGGMKLPEGASIPNLSFTTSSLSVSGGDIGRGLGWAALAFALTAALLPYFATALEAATSRTVRLLCLGIGGLIIVYLLTQNIRYIGIGLIAAAAGYTLEVVGMLRDRRAMAA